MYQTSIPVLFITFARPEYARQTFDGIKKAKPSNLYFYSNKARIDKPDEIDRNNTIRAYLKEIDWECDIKTYFRDEYVDIYTSLWGAIDWVFENEEQAIILEEDCVPSLAFFDFCEQLLPQYKDDQRVWVISGNNFIEGFNPNNYDYFFSPFAYQYGWASWKSRWNRLNRKGFNVTKIIEYDLYKQLYSSRKAANHAYRQLKRYGENIGIWKPEAWDYVFQMSMRINGGFGIVPKVNLVSNIGVSGVHNIESKKLIHNRKISSSNSYEINSPPPFVVTDYQYTSNFFKKITSNKKPFVLRLLNYLNRKIQNQ
jgi:hypothetical protein